MEVNSIPPKITLFKDVLYDKENNKLKKVKLKKWNSSPVVHENTVFTIDIQGIGHKFHLQLDFTEQEVCFVQLEELQDRPRETPCFKCFSQQRYTRSYYSRLLLLLYRQSDGAESKCVKVPLIQYGNIHAATTLRKLQTVINNNIVSSGDLQHWQVGVVTCGHLDTKDNVYVCLTKYAVAIVMCSHYQIMYHHPLNSSEITITCIPEENMIKLDVNDTSKDNQTTQNDNFIFARQYVFRTTLYTIIETSIKSAIRKSSMNPRGPSAHWNIVNRDLSVSGSIIPGTSSDNVVITAHNPHEFDNNNTGSSGSIELAYIAAHTPPPHIPVHQSGSAMGQNWSASSSSPLSVGSNSNMPINVDFDLQPSSREGTQLTRENDSTQNVSPPPCLIPYSGQGTDPSGKVGSLTRHSRNLSHTPSPTKTHGGFFIIDSAPMPTYADWRFLENGDEEELPPPPPPCSAQLRPHVDVEFKYKPPTPHKIHSQQPTELENFLPLESGQSSLMRSLSFMDITDLSMHSYVNVQYMMSMKRNVHDDNPYYHFYINFGYVTMSKKLERRNRMSKEFGEIDFNKLENHEEWYDIGFREREKDLRFCRVNHMNIKVEDQNYVYSHVGKEEDVEDDPYWSSHLAVTLQKVLQDSPGKKSALFQETRKCFDLTGEQLISIQVLLSLVPSNNNWKHIAEYIGLTISDISIIEHFCFTYRELAASVVLIHWLIMYQKGICDVKCDHDQLRAFLEEMQREDIRNILVSEITNLNEEEPDTEDTHF